MMIQPYKPENLEAVVGLSLRAWAPVFVSIEQAMDREVYQHFFPDWRIAQGKAVTDVLKSSDFHTWVAVDEDSVAGFVAVRLDAASLMGEIYMIAVDPAFQRRGAGAALSRFALDWMKSSGMKVAMVETGADPGHAPARATYEKIGFRQLPAARYFMAL